MAGTTRINSLNSPAKTTKTTSIPITGTILTMPMIISSIKYKINTSIRSTINTLNTIIRSNILITIMTTEVDMWIAMEEDMWRAMEEVATMEVVAMMEVEEVVMMGEEEVEMGAEEVEATKMNSQMTLF